jgi:hypothetical protein
MAFADWLLPLLLLAPDDEHGREPFDWWVPVIAGPAAQRAPSEVTPQV